MGWLVALGILVLLAVLPLGVSIKYDADGAVVKVIAGPVRITLYPRPKKEKKPNKETDKEKTDEARKAEEKKPADGDKTGEKAEASAKESGGPITDFLPLVRVVLDMLGAFRRKLRLNMLELKIIMAADDPCDLAVNYGRAWAAVGNLMPQLEKLFVIKKRNVEVECDFEAAQTRVIARLDLTITLGRIVATGVVYGVRALIEFVKIKNKRKGGAS